jgi:U3 small nucleolar RNA-associated protein 14
MSHIGLAHKKSITNNYKIDEESVQAGSIAKIDIANVLNSIEMYELAVDQGELDIANIQTLTVALYPKAIEYYSAFDNNMYNDLLNRM